MFTWIFFLGIAVWGIYRRVRRLVERQLYKKGWVIFRLVFSLMGIILLIIPRLAHLQSLIWVIPGLVIGIGMIYLSIRYTKIIVEASSVYYQTNPYLGTIMLILVLIRFIYKLPVLFYLTDLLSQTEKRLPQNTIIPFVMDPFSMTLVTIILIYFLGFNLYILWVAKRFPKLVNHGESNG